MATAEPLPEEGEGGRPLHTDSIPLVDLRLLSQSELFSLALSTSAPHSFQDDVVSPKIDRSVFNESAGSRKQTFSRLRLAPRGKQPPPPPPAPVPASHIPLDEEHSQIINLLETLFGVESLRTPTATACGATGGDVVDGSLVPVQVEFKQPESGALPYQSIPIDVVDGSTGRRKRGRPRKNENRLALLDFKEVAPPPPPRKAKVEEKEGEGLLEDGVGVDPIGEEVKRRTVGKETEAEMVELLEGLKGEWVSQRKKRKVVEASDLGPFLPSGWKVVLCVMKRAARASIVCRRYVSPYGPEFGSFKEVSAYLHSFYGEDINLLKSNYTDGSLQFLSNTNVASGTVVGQAPTGGIKNDASASHLSLPSTAVPTNNEKQATVSSSVGNEMLSTFDGNFNSSLAWGCKSGDTSSGAFGDFDHQNVDKQHMMDDKNTANSVQGSSFEEDRVQNQIADTADAACNLYIPLVFSNPFPNNNSGIDPLSDDINPVVCMESGISNFAIENRNAGYPEPAASGNKQANVVNGYGLSVGLVEDQRQTVGFERSVLSPNSEGNKLAGSLQDGHLTSSQEDMKISEGNFKDRKQHILSCSDQYGIKDVSTDVILQNSSDGFSLVSSQKGLEHMSIDSSDWIQTFLPEESDVAKCFDSDLPVDERTWVPSGYTHDDSFSTCTKVASEFGGVYVASNLSVTKGVSDNHAPPNEELVTGCAQDRSSLNDQNCKIDSLMYTSSKSNFLKPTGDEQHSGNFDPLKADDAGYKKPQSGIFSCNSNVAVDAYTNASIMQGRSQGFESVALAACVLNQFDLQSNYNVNNANKSCLSESPKIEQVDILQTNSKGMPEFR